MGCHSYEVFVKGYGVFCGYVAWDIDTVDGYQAAGFKIRRVRKNYRR
jgi:hypothetical protein